MHAKRRLDPARDAAAPRGVSRGHLLWHTWASMRYQRITVRLDQMDGTPCIRGLRIPVATVVTMVAEGMSRDEIVAAYPDPEGADVTEALHYAAEAVRERELPIKTVV